MKKIKGFCKKNLREIWHSSLLLFGVLCILLTGTDAGRAMTAVATQRDLPIYCVEKSEKVLSISFDAAWGNEDTAQIIEILDKYQVRATFFVVGDWARKYPESIKQLHDAGHEIMSHSDKHKHMTKLSRAEIMADIKACEADIEKITGVKPFLFRPPYGEYDNKVVGTLREMGYYTIQWDVERSDVKTKRL